jgi:uncharacterized protein (TIGR03437 family)
MRTKELLKFAAVVFLCQKCAPAQVITTFAGSDWLFPTNTLPAQKAPLGGVGGAALDAAGNLYIVDRFNAIVVRISPEGLLTVVAGNGVPGYSGDGGTATAATLYVPSAVAVDVQGNLFISDQVNNNIRKVNKKNGIITTVVGGGSSGALGDGGQALFATLNQPLAIALDPSGNLYVADTFNNRIRKVTPNGAIITVAGNDSQGFSGDGIRATSASLNLPQGVALDSSGNLYIADAYNYRIRKVTTDGIIHTIAGTGVMGFSGDQGPALLATLNGPSGLWVDAGGSVFVADSLNNRIRRITPDGIINTVAGSDAQNFSDVPQPAVGTSLDQPLGVLTDPSGNLVIADYGNYRVRKVTLDGVISTVAGNGLFRFSGDNGPASAAALNNPQVICFDGRGNFYIAELYRIRKVAPDGTISTIAGNGSPGFLGDGMAARQAAFNQIRGLAADSAGNLFVADVYNQRVRKIDTDGVINTIAGNGLIGFNGDGIPATEAKLNQPTGLAVDASGSLYISDHFNNRIRKVTPSGTISTVAGTGFPGFAGDGGPAVNAYLYFPESLTLDASGNLYIADTQNGRIRKVMPDGVISTIAGSGAPETSHSFNGDGGPATSASFNSLTGLTVDKSGNVFISDKLSNRVRQVMPSGIITTAAGNGTSGFSGDGGPASSAALNQPMGLAVDGGDPFIADAANNRIRKLVAASTVSYGFLPSSLSFSAFANGAPPQPQSITLSGSLAGIAFTITPSDSWLIVDQSAGAMPASLTVSIDPSKLTANSYQGYITISAPVASLPTQNIPVFLTVQDPVPPKLNVSIENLTFTAIQGSAPQTNQIQIRNTGGGTLSFTSQSTMTSGDSWLSISATSGTVTSIAPTSLTVTVTPGTLAGGIYQGSIFITSGSSTFTIAVTLVISAPNARILVSQTGLSFSAAAGGGAPLPQTFGILNIGQGPMDWTATADTLSGGQWLQLSASSGTVTQPFIDVSSVNVTVNPAGLSSGDYYGRIQISASSALSTQSITVILTVTSVDVTGPEVRPAALIFTGVAGASPGSQDVLVGNPKPVSDSYVSSVISNAFTYVPAHALVLPNQPTTLRVVPDFSKLQPGDIDRGTITLQFSDGTSRTISVLSVAAPLSSDRRLARQAFGCTSSALEIQLRSPTPDLSFNATAGNPFNIEAQVVDDCGNLIGADGTQSASVVASFSNQDSDIHLTHVGSGIWTGTWRPSNLTNGPVAVSLAAFNSAGTLLQSGQKGLIGTLSAGATPVVMASNVTQAASRVAGGPIAPGSLITFNASNLNPSGQGSLDLQTGMKVLLDDKQAPILSANDGQLTVQVPFDAVVNGQSQLTVLTSTMLSVPESVVVAQTQPGIFTVSGQGTGPGAIYKSDGVTLAQGDSPASVGEEVVIYATGLGQVNPPPPAGVPPPDSPLSSTKDQVTVSIDGQDATPCFAGLTPGIAGLYQVNAVVPGGNEPEVIEDVPVTITVGGVTSPVVSLRRSGGKGGSSSFVCPTQPSQDSRPR